MHSSFSDNDSDAMFPSSDHHLRGGGGALQNTSDLSPPLSQDIPSQNGPGTRLGVDSMDTAAGQIPDDGRKRDLMTVANILFKASEKSVEPGHAWKNRKAREEYSRAMESVLDKSFSLSTFSDIWESPQY